MLKQRIITALLALPALLFILTQGSWWVLLVLFSVFITLSVSEISVLVLPRMESLFLGQGHLNHATVQIKAFDVLLNLLLGFVIFLAYLFLPLKIASGVTVTCLLASVLIGALLATNIESAMGHALGYVLSITYGVLPWLLIWDLAVMAPGAHHVILLLAIVWSGDTGAYFGGKFLGKNYLAPGISPKKTWEGALAGLLASAIGGTACNWYYDYSLGAFSTILIASLLGGFCGQLGDLVESTFKRFARMKDSGTLFPGHGGFLDRCDAVLFAAPVLWFVFYFDV